MDKLKKEKKIIVYVLVGLFIALLLFVSRGYIIKLYRFLVNGEELKRFVQSFGYLSWLVFFLVQVVQVVIFFIPGEVIQAAGGYIFGTFFGTVISFCGIALGSYILFVVSQKFGRNFVRKIISKKTHNKFEKLLNNKNQKMIVFILYLIPGFPKDSLAMICGLTDLNAKDFIIWSMLGRIPALVMSNYFGANISEGKKVKLIIISIIIVAISIIAFIFKDKLLTKIKKWK